MALLEDLNNIIVGGPNDATNFAAQLMRIVFKADRYNVAILRTVYPNLVNTVRSYMATGEKLNLPYDN